MQAKISDSRCSQLWIGVAVVIVTLADEVGVEGCQLEGCWGEARHDGVVGDWNSSGAPNTSNVARYLGRICAI